METPIPQQAIRQNYPPQLPGTGLPPMMMGMRPQMILNPLSIITDNQ